MTSRGVSPVVGVVCLLAVTVVLASTIVVTVPADAALTLSSASAPTLAFFDLTATSDGEVRVTHAGGDAIDPEALDVHVRVDGEPLADQPPVPFFSARGFESGPTGAFNSASADRWRVGETASFRIASTNGPAIEAGDVVSVRLAVDGHRVAEIETTATS